MGKLFAVELVAKGYIETTCKEDALNAKTDCETAISLQIISVDTGRIVASKRVVEKSSDPVSKNAKTISRAVASKAVSDSIVYQLTKRWENRPASTFKIILSGLNSYEKYMQLRNVIISGNIKGLTAIVERHQSKGAIVFEGERRAKASRVHKNIISKCSAENKIEVKGKDDDFIEIELL